LRRKRRGSSTVSRGPVGKKGGRFLSFFTKPSPLSTPEASLRLHGSWKGKEGRKKPLIKLSVELKAFPNLSERGKGKKGRGN